MSGLQQLQQSFLGYLLGAPSRVVEQIESTPDTSAQQRLDIYASGYRLRLKEALSTDYERLHAYIGDDAFEQLMDCYIDRYHSSHPSLRYYSQHMDELISQQEPYCNVPELYEIARIERAFNDSFDATDCTVVDMKQLSQLNAGDWPALKLRFHASVQLLPCEYNSFPIWKALSEDATPPQATKDSATWLIWRRDLVSRYRALDEAEAHALDLAINGADFSEICEHLLDFFDEETTPQQAILYLQTWINEKMVCQLSGQGS